MGAKGPRRLAATMGGRRDARSTLARQPILRKSFRGFSAVIEPWGACAEVGWMY